ncbi:hypothetical protein F4781DRAFT_435486 [Annulohypoxylon bovei var. microspora]|nr:hypothetical protein F4781DRAFT_435486 [Annulohypoxylon bovei var. microspora]
MPPLCKFWQQGYCRSGASCRFDHPGENTTSSNPFGAPNSNTNRFSALNPGGNKPLENPYKITPDIIRADLLIERPPWLLSCYGPGRDAPEQLFGGHPREQSLEEIMVYVKSASNQQQAESEVSALFQQAEQQNQTALGNLDGAIQFVLASESKHPNRIDICNQNNNATGMFAREAAGPQSGFSNPLASNPFSAAPSQSSFGGSAPSFGQPSTMGQKPNPFGAAPAASTFGQPSAMGASKPAFGQSSQMGGAAPAFGQPSALGQKPNPFASTPSGPSGFGQAPQATQSAFGQPSSLGQKPNPFLAAASSTAPNPFSQPATTSAVSPFSQPAAANPFAQVTSPPPNDQSMDTSAPLPAASNPFAKPSAPSFGVPANNPFAAQKPTGFGAAASNPFAQAQAQSQGQTQPQIQPQSAPVGGANPYGPNSTKQHPAPESYISKGMNGRLMTFNGQQVVYKWKVDDKYEDAMPRDTPAEPPVPGVRNSDGSWRKIFFPQGPPAYNQDTEPDPSSYNATIKATYENTKATGRFDGDMPEVPPMREDCVWTF